MSKSVSRTASTTDRLDDRQPPVHAFGYGLRWRATPLKLRLQTSGPESAGNESSGTSGRRANGVQLQLTTPWRTLQAPWLNARRDCA